MKSKKWLMAICLIASGCFARSSMMTQETFDSVQVGVPINSVVQEHGDPYAIETKNGMEEYKYIERVTNGNQLIYETHFVLYVKGGVVVAKSSSQEKVPSYDLIYQDDPNHNQYP